MAGAAVRVIGKWHSPVISEGFRESRIACVQRCLAQRRFSVRRNKVSMCLHYWEERPGSFIEIDYERPAATAIALATLGVLGCQVSGLVRW